MPRFALLLVLGAMLVTGCESGSRSSPLHEPKDGKCGPNEFLYEDESCPPPAVADAASKCEPEGDGLCHERCKTDADCTDPGRPYCRVLGVFAGYDYNCNVGVLVCR